MVKVIVGMMGSAVETGAAKLATPTQVQAFLECVRSHGVTELDTARVYNKGRSEELLGEVSATKDFEVSTKAPGWKPGILSEPNILAACAQSLEALRQTSCDIYYIHGPDRTTPLEEQCRAFNTLYQQGKFKRFGISNLSDAEVQECHDICSKNGWVLPSVYQGGFSPLHKGAARTLFPLLKKLNMAYYAFTPYAGGLLAKPIDEILNPAPGTRYAEMPVFKDIFVNDTILAGLRKHTELCRDQGITVREATARWFMHHSKFGPEDGVIFGASSTEQIEASLSDTEKGPLPEAIVQGFEDMWEAIKEATPSYHG